MRSTKSIILIVIALGCGLIASIGISQVMDNRANATGQVETEAIYVASANVQSWVKLGAQHVKLEDWPKDKIPPGAARTLEEFEGMSPRYPLYPGEPIMVTKLSDGTTGISGRIPEGHQVFAVKVDRESSLSGLIHPGDKVDVLVFIRGRGGLSGGGIQTGTRTILKNITVFAVNDQIRRNTEDEETSIDAKTVSLLVKPQQSERLLLAKQLGTIHLALRKPGDETDVDTNGAKPGDLNGTDEGTDFGAPNTIAAAGPKPTGGIFGILDEMKARSSTDVDTSNATDEPTTAVVIMSPEGVINRYSFDGSQNAGNGVGLPQLPRELRSAYEAAGSSEDFGVSQDNDPSEVSAESEPSGDDDVSADDVSGADDDTQLGDDVIDAADLGL